MDASDAPLVRVAYPSALTLEGFEWVFARFAELASRGHMVAWCVDVSSTDATKISALSRKTGAEVYAAHQALLHTVTVCEARIVRGQLMQFVTTAYDWVAPRGWPCGNFTTEAEAIVFCERECRRRGVTL